MPLKEAPLERTLMYDMFTMEKYDNAVKGLPFKSGTSWDISV